MKLVVDMNLPPSLCESLRAHGFDAQHWSTVGSPDAPDRDVMAWAHRYGHVLLTHDLDFAALLAATRAAAPSVVQIRTRDVTAAALTPVLVTVLRAHAAAIAAGALVTIDESAARVRILPL